MKKIGLTLTLAAILAVGSTQTLANGGIVISGATNTPTQCEQTSDNNGGIVISGSNGGIVISGATGTACEEKGVLEQVWDSVTGIVISGFGIVISG